MPETPAILNPASLAPGTIVSVWVFPFFRHKGIVSDQWHEGRPKVISNSARAGGVTEESWDVFAAGQTVINEGYPSNIPPYDALYRARSRIGTKYQLLNWNCEHLTRYAHGLEPRSSQVAATLLLAAVAIGVAAARRG
jgi:hypothetical protein